MKGLLIQHVADLIKALIFSKVMNENLAPSDLLKKEAELF